MHIARRGECVTLPFIANFPAIPRTALLVHRDAPVALFDVFIPGCIGLPLSVDLLDGIHIAGLFG